MAAGRTLGKNAAMTDPPAMIARAVLDDLQDAAMAKDHAAMLALMTDDVVLFGTAAANLDRAAAADYLRAVVEQDGVIRWDWETVQVVEARTGAIVFVALGTVGLDGADVQQDAERQPIRLSALVVDDGDRWRLRHFHGSIPAG
jgi:ketosteroid isomerase-like protein